jgi:SAM-dependent methyltransferase
VARVEYHRSVPNASFKERLKRLAFRVMRPGLLEVNQRLWRIEQALGSAPPHGNGRAPAKVFGLWRGGLSGQAVDLFGNPLPDLTPKYRDELTYWQRMVKHDAPRVLGGPFEQVYGAWQRERIAELGQFLGLDGPEATARWCAQRSAVEIGAGPFPSVAAARWKRAVAIDPLADGYTAEDLLPKECHCDEVTYIAAPGEAVPLPGEFADVVVIENCLDHVDDPRVVVHEIARLLKPGGLLWLLVDLMEYRDHLHPNPFSEKSLRALLASEGFAVVKDRISDHKSHPNAYGEYRGLLAKPGSDRPMPEVVVPARTTAGAPS